MLKEINKDVWPLVDKKSVLCILTNDSICTYKEEITDRTTHYNPMYGGIAFECALRNPGIDVVAADSIQKGSRDLGRDEMSKCRLFRFSTKRQIFSETSDLNLIETSLKDLCNFINSEAKNKIIYLPRPGCGIGGLDWEIEVKPLVEKYLGVYENVFIVSK